MANKVVFSMPDAKARERIFRALAPVGVEKGMDFRALAGKFEFSGGQIKNVWLNAGRMAMKRTGGTAGTKITMAEMEEVARMEEKGAEAMETKLSSGSRKGYA
jgi:ATP-dependent 26S proteasome regulatory subunit